MSSDSLRKSIESRINILNADQAFRRISREPRKKVCERKPPEEEGLPSPRREVDARAYVLSLAFRLSTYAFPNTAQKSRA